MDEAKWQLRAARQGRSVALAGLLVGLLLMLLGNGLWAALGVLLVLSGILAAITQAWKVKTLRNKLREMHNV